MRKTAEAPWDIDSKGFERLMKIWGFTSKEFDDFLQGMRPGWLKIYETIRYPWPQEAAIRGDAIVAFLENLYMRRGEKAPKPVISEFERIENVFKEEMKDKNPPIPEECIVFDPIKTTYVLLKNEGFDAWIPSD